MKIVNSLLAFLLSLVLLLSALSCSLYFSVFNKEYVLAQFTSEEYVNGVYEDFIFKMESLAIPSYIEPECYESVFTKDRVREDITTYFEKTINGNEQYDLYSATIDMQKEFRKNLEDFSASQDVELTEAISTNISEYVEVAFDYYEDYITISYIEYYGKICEVFEQGVLIVIGVTLFVSLIICFILLKSKYDGRNIGDYLSYAFLAAALMGVLPPALSQYFGFYKSINISPEYMYNVVSNVLFRTQATMFVSVGILTVIGVFCAVLANILGKREAN